eukprot:CAMPEP_0173121970 /NCGR_PEP_ID=MMETSP1102-20130122/53788_1 /TAXON_ID=49646 /ORGANISM="Geminigera sp., Strain Caron Lab Isolate" /LENGTH=88 /DNA_ID=CAMNT_0014029049 /DNA_START=33 /DNA_END=296 /DNA_ORIENTATION=+
MFYDAEKKEHVAGGVDGKASIALDGLRLLRDVVARASKVLKAPVRELVRANGDLIVDFNELPDKVFALFEEDFFVYPTEYAGYKQTVE